MAVQKLCLLNAFQRKIWMSDDHLIKVDDRTKCASITKGWVDEGQACLRSISLLTRKVCGFPGVIWQIRDLPGQLEFASSNMFFVHLENSVVLMCINLIDG